MAIHARPAERAAGKSATQPEAPRDDHILDLPALSVAIQDGRDTLAHLQSRLTELSGVKGTNYSQWLDALVDIQVDLRHLIQHAEEAEAEVHQRILELQDEAGER